MSDSSARYRVALQKILEMAQRSDAHPDVQVAQIARQALDVDVDAGVGYSFGGIVLGERTGGGWVTVVVDRDTPYYPEHGAKVEVMVVE